MESLTDRFERVLVEDHLLHPGDRIVAAVSGGPDSTALLHLLFTLSAKWGWTLSAAHANHGFRPEESEREASFVEAFCRERGIPLAVRRLEVPAYLQQLGGNPQEAARELRYRFLIETAQARGAQRVALAHHADDQAETVLMRILRGTGLAGLAGIPAKRMEQNVELVRPLLRITKNELLEELHARGIGYCTDSSNAKTAYTRNRIRLETLPELADAYNPQLTEALNRLADMAAADHDFLEQEAERVFERAVRRETDGLSLDRRELASLHVALQRRLLKLILSYVLTGSEALDFRDVERLREAALAEGRPNGELWRTAGGRLVREYERLRLRVGKASRVGSESEGYRYPIAGEAGELVLTETGGRMVYRTTAREPIRPASEYEAVFDAETLRAPLFVRNRGPGDRMRPDGLNGTRKVKDILIDRKVPQAVRERTPVLTDREGAVLWIPGVRRSDAAKVTAATRLYLHMQYLPS